MEPTYTLEDLRLQLHRFRSEGIEGLPYAELSDGDRLMLERAEHILEMMTKEERMNLDLLLDEGVRQRIAALSGTQPKEVEDLMSQVAKVGMIMRQIQRMRSTHS